MCNVQEAFVRHGDHWCTVAWWVAEHRGALHAHSTVPVEWFRPTGGRTRNSHRRPSVEPVAACRRYGHSPSRCQLRRRRLGAFTQVPANSHHGRVDRLTKEMNSSPRNRTCVRSFHAPRTTRFFPAAFGAGVTDAMGQCATNVRNRPTWIMTGTRQRR